MNHENWKKIKNESIAELVEKCKVAAANSPPRPKITVKLIGGPFDGRSYPEDVHKHLPAFYQHIRYDFINDLMIKNCGEEVYENYKQAIYGDDYEEWEKHTIRHFEDNLIFIAFGIDLEIKRNEKIDISDFIYGLFTDGWFDVRHLGRDRELSAYYDIAEYTKNEEEVKLVLQFRENLDE